MHHNTLTRGSKFNDGYGGLLTRTFGGNAQNGIDEDEEEEAWMNAVRNEEGLDEVKGLTQGDLVIHLAEPPALPASTKKVVK